jgi:hypothetical protein
VDRRKLRALFRTGVALATCGWTLVFALPALANAPDPTSTTVDQVIVNPDGSRTVTVQGTWNWPTSSEPNCPNNRDGVGYQVDWFDNSANPIGTAMSPAGILYVGDATDNIVHSLDPLGGSNGLGNAFYDGVPSSYLTHNTTSTTPTATDAGGWSSNCGTTTPSGSSGTWGPITHTYAASFTGAITLCPVMYDPHGKAVNKGGGGSGAGDLTAGGAGNNNDNSYEGNGTLPGGNVCSTIKIPTLTTSAASANAFGGQVSDTATLTGSTGNGAITFKLYPSGANCTGTPLYTKAVPTTGDGQYQSGGFAPSASGTYQWQASFASSTITGLVSSCTDQNEQSSVPQGSTAVTPPHGGQLTPKVFAGYADGFRKRGKTSAPSPWQGSPGVIFKGCNYFLHDRCPLTPRGFDIYDAGAIRIDNTTGAKLTVTKASVVIGSCTFRPWPGLKVTLRAGKQLILTQTGGRPQCHTTGDKLNFDTSDTNHSCTRDHLIPVLHVTIDGVKESFADRSQILNTGGRDPGGHGCGKHKETQGWAKMPPPKQH